MPCHFKIILNLRFGWIQFWTNLGFGSDYCWIEEAEEPKTAHFPLRGYLIFYEIFLAQKNLLPKAQG